MITRRTIEIRFATESEHDDEAAALDEVWYAMQDAAVRDRREAFEFVVVDVEQYENHDVGVYCECPECTGNLTYTVQEVDGSGRGYNVVKGLTAPKVERWLLTHGMERVSVDCEQNPFGLEGYAAKVLVRFSAWSGKMEADYEVRSPNTEVES